jgi:dephospho-CoA kinase
MPAVYRKRRADGKQKLDAAGARGILPPSFKPYSKHPTQFSHPPMTSSLHRVFRVGLTGGIAAGKSAVAELWRAKGAVVIDSDALAHEALAPGTPTHEAVVKEFGAGVVNADGSINRAALGEIVFRNEERRLVLNGLVHPAVRQKRQEIFAELERGGADAVAVAVIPLLYEVGEEKEFDCVATVACSAATQLARLAAKGLSEPQARARIASQWPLAKKMDRADYVIWNDGSRQTLAQQADTIWNNIKETCHAARPTK